MSPAAAVYRATQTRNTVLRALPILVLAGAALRCFRFEHQSYWYDESMSARLASAGVWRLVTGSSSDHGNPPFYYALLHLWSLVFGTGDAALRGLSAAASVISIPLLYLVARRLTTSSTALVAAGILALSPVHVYFAQEARCYALVTALCLVSMLALLQALDKPARSLSWVGYAVATYLAIYTHYFAFFVVLAQLIYIFIAHRDRAVVGRFIAALTVMAAAYLTWLPSLLRQATTEGNLSRAADTWYLHILSTPLVFGVGTTLVWKDTVTPFRIAVAGVAVLSFGLPTVVGAWSRLHAGAAGTSSREARPASMPAPPPRPVLLMLLWLVLPVAIPFVVSLTMFPFFAGRYALLATPAFYILIAIGVRYVSKSAQASVVLGMAATAGLSLYWYFTTPVKHAWRDAVSYVDAFARPGDVLTFDADIGEVPFSRYSRGAAPRVRLMPPSQAAETHKIAFYGALAAGEIPRDVGPSILAGERVWLVLSDPHIGSGGHYRRVFEHGWRPTSSRAFRGVEVHLYERLTSSLVESASLPPLR